jgi:carbon-monoxide dehydrogenase large subunit
VTGLGAALSEEMAYDEDGRPASASLLDYALLGAGDIPELVTEFIQTPTPLNPLGAKGLGDNGATGVPAAVANAIADALGGAAIDPPFTAERVWRAL